MQPIRSPEAAHRSPSGRLRLEHWFAIALGVGALAIFFGEKVLENPIITIGGPLAVMAAYIAIGRTYLHRGLSRTQYADSIYYLGFMFTLVSITAAIMDYSTIEKVLSKFGVKLITTLVGLGVRVYLVNFAPSDADVVENVEESLALAARRMRERLDHVTLDLDALTTALALTLKTASERVSGETLMTITQANAHFRKTLEEISGQTTTSLVEWRANATKTMGDVSDGVRNTLAEVSTSSTKALKAVRDGTTSTVDAINDNITGATNALAGAISDFTERVRVVPLPADLFSRQLVPAVEQLVSELGQSMSSLGAVAKTFALHAPDVERVGISVKGLAESAGRLDEALAVVVGTGPSLRGLGDAANSAQGALGRLAEASNQSLARLDLTNRRSDEVAHAVEEQLRQLNKIAKAVANERNGSIREPARARERSRFRRFLNTIGRRSQRGDQ